MKIKYDKIADAIYIKLTDNEYFYGRDLDDLRRIDYNSEGNPRGIELLCVSHGVNLEDLPMRSRVAELLRSHNIPELV